MATAGEPRRLELEVRFDARPIEGRLYARDGDAGRDGAARPFSGWLGLMSAIEEAGEADRVRRDERGGDR